MSIILKAYQQTFYQNLRSRKGMLLSFLSVMITFCAVAQHDGVTDDGTIKSPVIDSQKVIHEIRLSREAYKQNPGSEDGFSHAQKAIDLSLVMNDTLLYARALDNLGLLYRYNQQYAQALSLHTKAYDLVKEINVPPVYKMIFANNAGVAARYFEKYDMSVLYYLDALRIAENEKDLKNIAISSNGLGNALGNIPGKQEESLAFFNRALEVEKLQNNTLGVAMNYLSISNYYINKNEFRKARQYLANLKKVNQDRNNNHGLAITDEYYGLSYLKEGKDYNQALSYFKSSLDRFRQIKDVQKQGDILLSMAKVSEKQGFIAQSLAYYNESMALAKQINSKGLVLSNAENLATIYERKGDLHNALKFYKIVRSYKDSIDLSDQQIKVAALTTKYDIDKKESRIALLENEKQLKKVQLSSQNEKIKQQQILFLLFGVLAVSVAVISIIQNKANKSKKKSEQLLALQEKERTQALYERDLAQAEMLASRMQINPHFLFNCLNAINYLIQKGDNKKATKYLIIFSRFVRMVLESSQSHVVPLEEELALIGHYLKLEENRFDQRFSYDISIDDPEKIKEVKIPPLLLQPFVENAILHGLLPSKKETRKLHIRVSFTNNITKVIIEDNGVGNTKENNRKSNSSHKSMGTKITTDRINHYNKNYNSHISYSTEVIKDESGLPDGTRVFVAVSKTPHLQAINN
jgi:tetratricopeptide (TPR) repeat protein